MEKKCLKKTYKEDIDLVGPIYNLGILDTPTKYDNTYNIYIDEFEISVFNWIKMIFNLNDSDVIFHEDWKVNEEISTFKFTQYSLDKLVDGSCKDILKRYQEEEVLRNKKLSEFDYKSRFSRKHVYKEF